MIVSRFGRLPSGPSPLPMPPPNSMTVSTPESIAVFMQPTHCTGIEELKEQPRADRLAASSMQLARVVRHHVDRDAGELRRLEHLTELLRGGHHQIGVERALGVQAHGRASSRASALGDKLVEIGRLAGDDGLIRHVARADAAEVLVGERGSSRKIERRRHHAAAPELAHERAASAHELERVLERERARHARARNTRRGCARRRAWDARGRRRAPRNASRHATSWVNNAGCVKRVLLSSSRGSRNASSVMS